MYYTGYGLFCIYVISSTYRSNSPNKYRTKNGVIYGWGSELETITTTTGPTNGAFRYQSIVWDIRHRFALYDRGNIRIGTYYIIRKSLPEHCRCIRSGEIASFCLRFCVRFNSQSISSSTTKFFIVPSSFPVPYETYNKTLNITRISEEQTNNNISRETTIKSWSRGQTFNFFYFWITVEYNYIYMY